jgi:hypothetical protein
VTFNPDSFHWFSAASGKNVFLAERPLLFSILETCGGEFLFKKFYKNVNLKPKKRLLATHTEMPGALGKARTSGRVWENANNRGRARNGQLHL